MDMLSLKIQTDVIEVTSECVQQVVNTSSNTVLNEVRKKLKRASNAREYRAKQKATKAAAAAQKEAVVNDCLSDDYGDELFCPRRRHQSLSDNRYAHLMTISMLVSRSL